MAMILSAVLMLGYIGETGAAARIEKALCGVLEEKRMVTHDLGGTAGTQAFTQAIVQKLKTG
jgi:isocitrate dehydrogenase (NAD+)